MGFAFRAFTFANPALFHLSMNPDYFGKISSALRPILEKLTSKGVGYLLSPGDIEAPPDVILPGPAG